MALTNTEHIKNDINKKVEIFKITEKFYNIAKSEVFKDNLDLEYEIKKQISEKFSISLSSIKIVGSAHIGTSPFKSKEFEIGNSDLDVSLVDERLFYYFLHEVILITNNYSVQTFFKDNNAPKNFRYKVSRGILDFTFLKNIDKIDEFNKFFLHLSNNYFDWFKEINARIYLSETCMTLKQIDNIQKIKDNN